LPFGAYIDAYTKSYAHMSKELIKQAKNYFLLKEILDSGFHVCNYSEFLLYHKYDFFDSYRLHKLYKKLH